MNSNAEFNVIAALDLDPIKVKLMHKESGEGWSLEQVTRVELEYRRFLCLMKLFPEEQIAPFFDVDIFWHYHILDTMKYAADCEQIFGYFLHHFPYVGLGGEDDLAIHDQVGIRMHELYEATFGKIYIRHEKEHSTTAKTAFSMNVAQNDSVYLVGQTMQDPALRAKMAFSMNVAQNHGAYSAARAVEGKAVSAQTAFSMNVARNDSSYSVRPAWEGKGVSSTPAFSMNVTQKNQFNLVRPVLAKAA